MRNNKKRTTKRNKRKSTDYFVILPELQPLDYYVYLHRKLSNMEVFYVGKGKGDRFKRFSNRSTEWKQIALSDGVLVEILCQGLSEEEAYKFEIQLISKYGRSITGEGILVNLHSGGPWSPYRSH